MGSPLTSPQFVKLLTSELDQVAFDHLKDLPSMIPKLFTEFDSESAWSEFAGVGDVPDITEFNGKISFLPVSSTFHTKIEPKEFADGIEIERKLVDDEKYGIMRRMNKKLMDAAVRTQDKQAVRIFGNAFSSAFDYQTSEEGVALCSNSHKTKSGTSTSNGFDNLGTAAFSKTALAAARLAMRQFRSDISERIEIGDRMSIIHPDNINDLVEEVIGTPSGYDTAGSDINMANRRNYTSIPYLRLDDYDTNNWFLVDDNRMKDNLFFINRTPIEPKSTVDFKTYGLLLAVYFRVAFGFIDWRWIYGNQVS